MSLNLRAKKRFEAEILHKIVFSSVVRRFNRFFSRQTHHITSRMPWEVNEEIDHAIF